MKKKYDVTGMGCAACSARIEKGISKMVGVIIGVDSKYNIDLLHQVCGVMWVMKWQIGCFVGKGAC